MRLHRRSATKPSRLGLALVIGIGVSMVLAITVLAASRGTFSQTPAQKQAKLQHIAAQATASAKSPQAPKHPVQAPSSCPLPPVQSGLSPGQAGGFHEHILNGAVVAPSSGRPFEYLIYAGSRQANPQQGLLIVVRLDQDPCAPGAAGTRIQYYNTPFQQGALTLTQLTGDTVTFTTAAGGSGHFNYVTGQFS